MLNTAVYITKQIIDITCSLNTFAIIPLHQRHPSQNEKKYLLQVLEDGILSGGGTFLKRCEHWFEEILTSPKALLTHSCTGALEISALLLDINEGDEVIVPSYTFVSTANAFALRGAKLRFADSLPDHPNIQLETILPLVNSKTRAIVVVHYGGMAVDMDPILDFAKEKKITVIEDAAHSIHANYKNKPLGSLGDLSCFSFHDTKPIGCGEGGILAIQNEEFIEKAVWMYDKGTNRQDFLAGKSIDYQWKSLGSSYNATELQAAVLLSQLEESDRIFSMRQKVWDRYIFNLQHHLKYATLPKQNSFGNHNTSVFYILCDSINRKQELQKALAKNDIQSAGHYLCLHQSPYIASRNNDFCPNAVSIEGRLLRLPIYSGLDLREVDRICEVVMGI